MLTVYITKGLPASGKSTWSIEMMKTNLGSFKRVNKDLLREMLDGGHWSKGNEKFVVSMRDQIIREALANGKHVIVDDTNLNPAHIKQIKAIAKEFKARIQIVDFTDVGVEECIKRDSKRSNYVGEKVIRDMYDRWMKDKEYRKPKIAEQDPSLPHAIICDLDGTLALLNGRNPYDASDCENDLVNHTILNILKGQIHRGLDVIFVSGRTDKYKKQTEEWIKNKCFNWWGDAGEEDLLFMRKEGDTRKDAIIKKEILDNEIKGKFYIDFVLDDRLSVCQMWYDNGYTVLRVGDPSANF